MTTTLDDFVLEVLAKPYDEIEEALLSLLWDDDGRAERVGALSRDLAGARSRPRLQSAAEITGRAGRGANRRDGHVRRYRRLTQFLPPRDETRGAPSLIRGAPLLVRGRVYA